MTVQSIAAHRSQPAESLEDGLGSRMFDRVRQVMCGLHGHDTLVQFEQDRMFLRCVSCGYETHGWEIADTQPVARIHLEARPKPLTRPHLVGERKIA